MSTEPIIMNHDFLLKLRTSIMRKDYLSLIITHLLEANYDVFLPINRPQTDELIIFDGSYPKWCLIKRATMDKQRGPYVQLRNNRDYLLSSRNYDFILVIETSINDCWLVPITEIKLHQTVRLGNRDIWLVKPIKRTDTMLRLSEDKEEIKDQKAQMLAERVHSKDAEKERDFYMRIMNE